jgi:hypothetical protein
MKEKSKPKERKKFRGESLAAELGEVEDNHLTLNLGSEEDFFLEVSPTNHKPAIVSFTPRGKSG